MFDVGELYLTFQGNRGGFLFLKGIFQNRFFKRKIMWWSAERGCWAQKHQFPWFLILCSFDKYVSCALLVDRILSGDPWWRYCPSSRRLRLQISFLVSREMWSGCWSTVTLYSLKLPVFCVGGTVSAYSVPQVNFHFYPKIRVTGWVITKEVLTKTCPLLGHHSPVV